MPGQALLARQKLQKLLLKLHQSTPQSQPKRFLATSLLYSYICIQQVYSGAHQQLTVSRNPPIYKNNKSKFSGCVQGRAGLHSVHTVQHYRSAWPHRFHRCAFQRYTTVDRGAGVCLDADGESFHSHATSASAMRVACRLF